MKKYLLKKILFIIPMLLLISFLIFGALALTPADPINYLISPDMVANTENLEALKQQLGLNDPFLVRYFKWLLGLLKGDFGYSIVNGTSIKDILIQRIPATFELALSALIISTILGISLGIAAAVYQNSIFDNIARFFTVLGTSLPEFFFGIILINILGIKLNLLPIGGRFSAGDISFIGRLPNLILPSFTMAIALTSNLLRYTRNSMLDVFNQDYVKTARAKGVPEIKVYVKHIFRNALRPILVLLIFRLPALIGGSVIIESVFSWPGLGSIILTSLSAGDYPVIMITTLMIATAILLSSLLVDIVIAYLDPRVRI